MRGQIEERFTADIVVVAAGAVNSAALLLRSWNERHPNGLANSSDHVGRHYMHHNNSAMVAVSKTPNPTKFQKTIGLTIIANALRVGDRLLERFSMRRRETAGAMATV